MRFFALVCLAALILQATGFAQQSTTPGYTRFDQQQFAKLRATTGVWTCTDVPASKKPDVITTKQNGNWFISDETGDSPNTSYTRWSHGYQHFFTVTMDPPGDATMMSTTSRDPFNGVWTYQSPSKTPDGKPLPPVSVKFAGGVLTTTGTFYDSKNKLQHFSQICRKTG